MDVLFFTILVIMAVTNCRGDWGEWMEPEMCPPNHAVHGFSLQVEGSQGSGDDTALNGIRLYCQNLDQFLDGGPYVVIQSGIGGWGYWTTPQFCGYKDYISAYQLRKESDQGYNGDNTAANNVNFRCSGMNFQVNYVLYGGGMSWGTWSGWSSRCWSFTGLKTKIQKYQGRGDDTALNDVFFYC